MPTSLLIDVLIIGIILYMICNSLKLTKTVVQNKLRIIHVLLKPDMAVKTLNKGI